MKKKKSSIVIVILLIIALVVPIGYSQIGYAQNYKAVKKNHFDGVIRLNQLGYENSAKKVAYAITNSNLNGEFYIYSNNKKIYTGHVGKDLGALNKTYKHVYPLDFSKFNTTGEKYTVVIDSVKSPEFEINENLYDPLVPLMIDWFDYQKCGVKTSKHEQCHQQDAVKGGWHDAGDYIKFTITTSWTSIAMSNALLQNTELFENYGTDKFRNEINVGLEFINNMWDNENKTLYYQVSNYTDHDLDWRLPDDDENPIRQAFKCEDGQGGDVAGNAAAALALGSLIYKDVDKELSNKYLTSAQQIYEWGKNRTIPHEDIADGESPYYTESKESLYCDLALSAVELYRATQSPKYLVDAKKYIEMTDDGTWQPFVIYELGKLDKTYTKIAVEKLKDFVEPLYENVKSEKFKTSDSVAGWTHMRNLFLNDLIAQWYKDLSNDDSYDSIVTNHFNYMLGCNPWGYSFLQGVGSKYSKVMHHNISIVNNDYLLGTVSQGPCDYETLKQEGLLTKLGSFDTEKYAFGDSPKNYCCCEPTIYSNAYAIWVFSYYLAN